MTDSTTAGPLARVLTELGWKPEMLARPLNGTALDRGGELRVVTDAGSMDRRILLTLLGAAVCVPAHEWLIARPEAEAALARRFGAPLSVGFIDGLDDIVGQLRRMDDQAGSGTLLQLVRGQLRYVLALLDRHRYTETVGRRLHATAGELMRLAGWLLFDNGCHPQAQRYWVAGLHAARTAGDRALGANIVGSIPYRPRTSARSGSRSRWPRLLRPVTPVPRLESPRSVICAQPRRMPVTVQPLTAVVHWTPLSTGSVTLPRPWGSRAGVTGSTRLRRMPWLVSATCGRRTGSGPASICVPHCACRTPTAPARARCATSFWPTPTCVRRWVTWI